MHLVHWSHLGLCMCNIMVICSLWVQLARGWVMDVVTDIFLCPFPSDQLWPFYGMSVCPSVRRGFRAFAGERMVEMAWNFFLFTGWGNRPVICLLSPPISVCTSSVLNFPKCRDIPKRKWWLKLGKALRWIYPTYKMACGRENEENSISVGNFTVLSLWRNKVSKIIIQTKICL